MKDKRSVKGTPAYIVGEVKRFDQKHEMFKRSIWDQNFSGLRDTYYGPAYPKNREGFSLEDLSLFIASWYLEWGFAWGTAIHNTGLYSWDPPPSATKRLPQGLKMPVNDTETMSRHIKKVAKYFGASSAGIAGVDQLWLYSHSFNMITGEHSEFELPKECKYAIVIVQEMDYELVKTSPTWLSRAAEGKGYSMMPVTASMLAQFIRGLGYKALPSGNDSALSIPLAIDAGLGELGRNGLLITPQYGPRVRISKVFTDLPLLCDEPIRFGVLEFCEVCKKCAKHCPGQAIMHGERTTESHNICNATGVLKWPIDAEKCFAFWARNQGACTNCIRVCPFNKPKGLLHEWVRWHIKYTPWLDSFMVMMDDILGYGKPTKPGKYWE